VTNNDNVPIELPSPTLLGEDSRSTSHIIHKPNKRYHKDMSTSKHKRHKQSHNETSSTVLLDQFDSTDSASNDSENELPTTGGDSHVHTNQSATNETPTFVGWRVIEDNKKSKKRSDTLPSSATQQLLTFSTKLESQYLRPLLVGQERIEAMIKCLFANQKKIQNILRKQKVVYDLSDHTYFTFFYRR
jgi:hypothetical protein